VGVEAAQPGGRVPPLQDEGFGGAGGQGDAFEQGGFGAVVEEGVGVDERLTSTGTSEARVCPVTRSTRVSAMT
jgi:hypothetical protein